MRGFLWVVIKNVLHSEYFVTFLLVVFKNEKGRRTAQRNEIGEVKTYVRQNGVITFIKHFTYLIK